MYLTGKDISHWNGAYTDTGEDFVMIKMSGGDAGLYLDSAGNQHYNAAYAAGKVVGMYHFAGGTDPIDEANYFVDAVMPFAEYDLYALDWEVNNADPVGWCLAFVNEVHAKTGVWPFIYMDISRLNGYDWSPVLANCPLWLAAPSYAFDATAPVNKTYVMQQGGIVNGIDSDAAFFESRADLQKCGWHSASQAPAVDTPVPAPTPTPPTVATTINVIPPVGPVLPTLVNNVPTPPPIVTPPLSVPNPSAAPAASVGNDPIAIPNPRPASPTVVTVKKPKFDFWAWLRSLFTKK